jgi:N-acyl amino acid synthase of PEP-CTERM/exosortase system
MKHFVFKSISRDDPLITEVYRLRYKVYCEEWGFEKPEDHHPGGLEYDEYDSHSVHVVALLKESLEIIGTIRIILDSELGFPIEKHCSFDADLSYIDRTRVAEISRLAVSKEYRKRAVDKLIYDDDRYEKGNIEINHIMKERRKHDYFIIMGLYTCMYKESMALGLSHWFGLMANGLRILLRRMNIHFVPVGPVVDYHGLRVPYIGAIDEIAGKAANEKGEFLQEYDRVIDCSREPSVNFACQ